MTGSLGGPLARIKVDEKSCFGMIEWKAVCEASHVEQEGLAPMPKDRGAEQGDVDGPPGTGHGGSRGAREHRCEASGRELSWIGVNDPAEVQRQQTDCAVRVQESANFQLGGPEKLTGAHDPHALQNNGGLADLWFMDDGDIMCHPIVVMPFLQDFDVANARVGAEPNPLKTEVIYFVNDLDAAPPEWKIGDVRSLAKTSAVAAGGITLGVAVGSRQLITDKLLSKADVIRATHEHVQLSQDPQTEFSLSAVSTTSCGFTAKQSWRNKVLQRSETRSGSGLSKGSSLASRGTA